MRRFITLLTLTFIASSSLAQVVGIVSPTFKKKSALLGGIEFDSSYCIIGIGQGYDYRVHDSLTQFWFMIDNPDEMYQLKQQWIFTNPVGTVRIEEPCFNIMIIKDKREVNAGALIYPRQGIIKSEIAWFHFDTSELIRLHKEHPVKYHTEKRVFDTWLQYVAFANSIVNDSLLIFFMEPNVKYEGKFTILADRSNDESSPTFVLSDVNKELLWLSPEHEFQAVHVLNDSFNIVNSKKVIITVHCAKKLYDRYKLRGTIKQEWQPATYDIKMFWRDW